MRGLQTRTKSQGGKIKKFYIFGSIILIDQLAKFLIERTVTINIIGDFLRFSVSKNTGAGFSILSGQNSLLIVLSIAIIVGLIWFDKKQNLKYTLPIYIILAGAVGNLIDRILYGHVIDFISVWIWPVFNIADSAISVGAFWLIYMMYKK